MEDVMEFPTRRVTYDRRQMEALVAAARADGSFVRMNERQVRVRKGGVNGPRVRFEVVTK
jgi:uncharacterized membrane protein YebE (DUF533 family)